jgi:enamine deaminase RidA (YjgF/YER057c/UK114 family)
MTDQSTTQSKVTVDSGTKWEALAGYSRAVRYGNQIFIAGTTATDEHGQVVGPDDPAAQAQYIIDKFARTLAQLGSRLEDVVRTRIYLRHVDDWEPVARVHGERFGTIRPANTLIQALLVGDEYLVEIEADALVGAGGVDE